MPKFRDLSEYAAEIAPVINVAHVNVHASAAPALADLAATSGLTPAYLYDLRFTLPLRPLPRTGLAALYRYASDQEHTLRQHLDEGTLTEDGDGLLRLTGKGLAFVHRLYDLHAAAVGRVWAGHDLAGPAELVGRVLDAAERLPGGALELVAPPYEPEGSGLGLRLFNRLAVLRYHRADAHAAAWAAAGLSATEIVGLRDGPERVAIETETNRRAAAPYGVLSERERDTLYDALLKLV
ncbi:hypothetical protein B0I32_13830 [Nonomuraea fuscirosea]|uniref:Uncharacterized protein n=1 Tax=Nonomuraea fuscirosea TaxID=1291556 RepID=A0A2T0LZS2_9ACTN|nr:hypothetical protein B0I32_13830 [Nonomuraea fuscirosea]